MGKRKLFCELCPAAYKISLTKEIARRHLKNLFSNEHFARHKENEPLPVVVSTHSNALIKRGPGINPALQEGKAENIRLACSKINGLVINSGETFSFWLLVGKTTKRNGFSEGRVIQNGKLIAGIGGGLCNLANSIHRLVLHSPLTVTEIHHHSDALAPDPKSGRVPYSAGTSVNYNFIDYRFRNDTSQAVQLLTWCDDDNLYAELRTTAEFPTSYEIVEEDHHFHLSNNGKYYRISKIYRETKEKASGRVLAKDLIWDNRSEVMFDPALIPQELIL